MGRQHRDERGRPDGRGHRCAARLRDRCGNSGGSRPGAAATPSLGWAARADQHGQEQASGQPTAATRCRRQGRTNDRAASSRRSAALLYKGANQAPHPAGCAGARAADRSPPARTARHPPWEPLPVPVRRAGSEVPAAPPTSALQPAGPRRSGPAQCLRQATHGIDDDATPTPTQACETTPRRRTDKELPPERAPRRVRPRWLAPPHLDTG